MPAFLAFFRSAAICSGEKGLTHIASTPWATTSWTFRFRAAPSIGSTW
jgi:hypothetical protein